MSHEFRVGLTRDFLNDKGDLVFSDIGLGLLDASTGVNWEFLPRAASHLEPGDLQDYDGVMLLAPQVSAASLVGNTRLLVLARFGVGFDSVDVSACTEAGVALTITPDGVRRPVATALLASVLALALRLKERDRLVRESRWAEKMNFMGLGLTGRVLGIVGLGNIGREFSQIAQPLEMRHLAFDPYVTEGSAAAVGAELVELDELLRASDFVCVCCPLTESTYHLIGEREIASMKAEAYLVNAARGPIVDEAALIKALEAGVIRGAALDVFDPEPPSPGNPLLHMDNVLLTPHSIAHTDECFRLIGQSSIRGLLAAAQGEAPANIVNREVLDTDAFRAKIGRWSAHSEGDAL